MCIHMKKPYRRQCLYGFWFFEDDWSEASAGAFAKANSAAGAERSGG